MPPEPGLKIDLTQRPVELGKPQVIANRQADSCERRIDRTHFGARPYGDGFVIGLRAPRFELNKWILSYRTRDLPSGPYTSSVLYTRLASGLTSGKVPPTTYKPMPAAPARTKTPGSDRTPRFPVWPAYRDLFVP